MLVEIDDKIISTEIFTQKFVCDLSACKGACCVEGDNGAPLTSEEFELIQNNLEKIKPFMTSAGIDEVEQNGVSYLDEDQETVTALLNGRDCAFVFKDENGIAKCSIEKAYREKKTDFNKPISCHLYPIRVKKFGEYTALNYDRWKICKPACSCGEKLQVSVYRFLKEPLIRAFGESFYKELELVDKEISSE
jgi:hypothetical protein